MSRILLVEDDPWYAAQQMRILSSAQYEVAHASDAQSAMDAIDVQRPDALLLDILLTYNTAFALLHELRSHKETRRIPIIICSTQADMFERDTLATYGVVEILDKTTMDPSDSVRVLRRIGV